MKIIVLGFGIMGKQISSLMCLMGYDVSIWAYKKKDDDDKQLNRQIKLLKRQFKIEKEDVKYEFIYDANALERGIYIECIKEDLDLKKKFYNDMIARSEMYFSNTSSYQISEIGEMANGLHFFNPISLKLLEYRLVKNNVTSKILFNDLDKFGFTTVPVNDNRGFIANYILFNEISMIFKLIEKYNYSYESINKIYSKLYDGRNIFQVIDIVGIDVTYTIIKNLSENDKNIYLPELLKKALNKEIYGKKNKTSILEVL